MSYPTNSNSEEQERSLVLQQLALKLIPKFGPDWNADANLFLRRQSLSRILYFHALYEKILSVPGHILEFGCKWGASLPLLMGLRGIYEPFNYTRGIVGFDTFEGLSGVSVEDGPSVRPGDLGSDVGHRNELLQVLSLHSQDSPLPHKMLPEVIQGDVSNTIGLWLADNPHAMVSMAIFDMDIYRPTRDAIRAIYPRLTRGALLVFDELNTKMFPGETIAVMETFGLGNLKLQRTPLAPTCSFAVFDGEPLLA